MHAKNPPRHSHLAFSTVTGGGGEGGGGRDEKNVALAVAVADQSV